MPTVLTPQDRERLAIAETARMESFYNEREAGRERLNAAAVARAHEAAAARRAAGEFLAE